MSIFRISVQDGTKFSCPCQKFHPMTSWGKSLQIENTWVCATQNSMRNVPVGDSSEDITSQLSKVENHGEEEYRSETSITKLRRQAWENWIRSKNPEHTAATPFEPALSRGRSVSRKRSIRGKKVTMGPFFDNRADTIWKVLVRERLVNSGIRPNVNSTKLNPVVRLETSVFFRIARLMNNQIKSQNKSFFPKRREGDDKNAVAIVKSVSQ